MVRILEGLYRGCITCARARFARGVDLRTLLPPTVTDAIKLPPRRKLVEADATARLLNKLDDVRRTYKPQAGYLTDVPLERPDPVRYPSRPAQRTVGNK